MNDLIRIGIIVWKNHLFKAMLDARIKFRQSTVKQCFSDPFSLQSKQLQPDHVDKNHG